MSHYVTLAAKSLTASSCATLSPAQDDHSRNLYADPKNYTGYILNDTIKTSLNLGDIPTPKFAAVKTYEPMDQPEGPLPPNFPLMPENPPGKPAKPSPMDTQNMPDFSQVVKYQVFDAQGPGCGWAWTSHRAPLVDEAQLKSQRASDTEAAQLSVDQQAGEYVNAKIASAKNALNLMNDINSWNSYVEQVLTVQSKWSWLNEQRELLATPWYNYVAAHDKWINFDNTKANAQKSYDAAVSECQAANTAVSDWERTWTPSIEQYNAQKRLYDQQYAQYQSDHAAWEVKKKAWDAYLEQGTQIVTLPTPAPTTPTPTGDPQNPLPPTPTIPTPQTPTPTPTPTVTQRPTEPAPPAPGPEPTFTLQAPQQPSVPPRPAGCDSKPERPSVIDQARPTEPQPPAIPEGVTIPDSWPRPLSEPSVRLN